MCPWKSAYVCCCTLPRTIMVDLPIISARVSCSKVAAWMGASNAANSGSPRKIRIRLHSLEQPGGHSFSLQKQHLADDQVKLVYPFDTSTGQQSGAQDPMKKSKPNNG